MQASNGELQVSIKLPDGFHLTKGANSHFEAMAANAAALSLQPSKGTLSSTGRPSATIEFRRSAGTVVWVKVVVYFCQKNDVCLFEEAVFKVPFATAAEGRETVLLEHEVSASAKALTS